MADDVLHAGVRGVTDLMVMPGLINLDFADIRAVMSEMGKAMMGTGEADGERRAIDAAEAAISNPLLEDVSMKGARGVLINITGGNDMTLFEVDEAANRIREEVDPEANIIFGSTFDENLSGKIRISVVATGIDGEAAREAKPTLTVVAGGKEATPAPTAPAVAPGPQAGFLREAASALAVEAETPAPAAAIAEQAALAGGAFIAPKPVEPAVPRPVQVAAPVTTSDAAATTPAKRRGPSLFERVTGVGRVRPAASPAAQPDRPAPAQPRLGAIDPADRLGVSKSEDELLDIPAFLRRQAN
jgi:cell division protein FtsZ